MSAIFLTFLLHLLVANVGASPLPASRLPEGGEGGFSSRIDAPLVDVVQAVREVTTDQIIHGTYSYDKERTLYGAHAANSSALFKDAPAGANVFYKVAEKVLAPRNFKNTGDVGTIAVRYVVEAAGANATIIRIDAVFVDAGNRTHPSQGVVEAAEFAAMKEHVQAIALKKEEQVQEPAHSQAEVQPKQQPTLHAEASSLPASPSSDDSAQDLEAQIEQVRRQIVVRVKEAATPLKSAPFKSASNTRLLSARAEVVILIVTPYWYGIETEDGNRGWIRRSEVEPLP